MNKPLLIALVLLSGTALADSASINLEGRFGGYTHEWMATLYCECVIDQNGDYCGQYDRALQLNAQPIDWLEPWEEDMSDTQFCDGHESGRINE